MRLHQDLNRCAEIALREMIAWITACTGLSRKDAYMLCSLAGDLRISLEAAVSTRRARHRNREPYVICPLHDNGIKHEVDIYHLGDDRMGVNY